MRKWLGARGKREAVRPPSPASGGPRVSESDEHAVARPLGRDRRGQVTRLQQVVDLCADAGIAREELIDKRLQVSSDGRSGDLGNQDFCCIVFADLGEAVGTNPRTSYAWISAARASCAAWMRWCPSTT